MTAQRGGILIRTADAEAGDGALLFVPAEIAARVTSLAALTPVEGMRAPAIGIALVGGDVVTVLRLEPARKTTVEPRGRGGSRPPGARGYRVGEDWPLPGADKAVLCDVGGEPVALTGGTVVATGVFDADEAGVLWRGARVATLDVRALYAQAEAAIWAARVGGATGRSSP